MDNIAGSKSSLTWAVHLSVLALVLLWLFPTVGLLVSSFRTADQISASGWWKALFPAEQTVQLRTGGAEVATREGDLYVIEGNFLSDEGGLGAEALGRRPAYRPLECRRAPSGPFSPARPPRRARARH